MAIEPPTEKKAEELRCPRCQRRDIVPSLPRGITDMFMEGLGKIPRHCRSCGKRFYVDRALVEPGTEDEDQGES